jgi:NAD(P)H dehydrogenase (quinone)
MHALIVTAHPEPVSLTHSIAARIAEGISRSGAENSFEIADLAAEGFDPRFSQADLAVHRKQAPPPADVAAEQARIDRADALVLVYPVYWWSMPGLLKGWIDRVFANGWAYDEGPDTKLVKKLQRLKVHLVGIGGADAGTYAWPVQVVVACVSQHQFVGGPCEPDRFGVTDRGSGHAGVGGERTHPCTG